MSDKVVPIDKTLENPSVIFTRAEVLMLWQIVNHPGISSPLKDAAVAAEFFATVKTLAEWHGLPMPKNE